MLSYHWFKWFENIIKVLNVSVILFYICLERADHSFQFSLLKEYITNIELNEKVVTWKPIGLTTSSNDCPITHICKSKFGSNAVYMIGFKIWFMYTNKP